MTQVLKDWLRAGNMRSVRTFAHGDEWVVRLSDDYKPLSLYKGHSHHPDLDTAERLAVLNATGELEAEDD
jgi:hypothetical protein